MVVQEMKGETENTSQNISDMCTHVIPTAASLQSETLDPKPENLSSFENKYMPKVRKAYTITKQREKWTEEEHQKFLEALKLYGRAWRHIEEHIGTKTAVQIRSHAQKFFSKVARDSNSVSAGSHVSIEIPPPRPKKKPLHPYPRKVADLFMKQSVVSDQPGGSLSIDDVENLSPTSILPTRGSDPISPAVSELNTHCLSPISCPSDPPSGNSSSTEKDHECMTSNSCATKEILPSSVQEIPSSKPENLSPSSSIKLFGKIVLITDSKKPSTLTEECNDFFSNKSREDKFVDQNKLLEALPTENMERQVSYEMLYSSTQTCEKLSETGSLNEDESHADAVSRALSCWSSSKRSPQRAAANLSLEQRLVDEETGDLGSSCSISGSVNEVYGVQMYPGANGSQYPTNTQPRRGFVPYKRCAEEIDTMSLVHVFEESETKKIRACS